MVKFLATIIVIYLGTKWFIGQFCNGIENVLVSLVISLFASFIQTKAANLLVKGT